MKSYGQIKQGFYKPMNPSKWNSVSVPWLSSWERKCYIRLDQNPKIVEIKANSFTLPYICATDHKQHRYYMDIVFKYQDGDKTMTFMVEVKPNSQIFPPKPPKRKSQKSFKTYTAAMNTYAKNISKWKAASDLAKINGWIFLISTEKGFYTFSNNQLTKISNISIF